MAKENSFCLAAILNGVDRSCGGAGMADRAGRRWGAGDGIDDWFSCI